MTESCKEHERSQVGAEIFFEDITQFDLNLVPDNFITENIKVAKDHLKAVQSASLYWMETYNERGLQESKDIRIKLIQFIKDTELKQKKLLEKAKNC